MDPLGLFGGLGVKMLAEGPTCRREEWIRGDSRYTWICPLERHPRRISFPESSAIQPCCELKQHLPMVEEIEGYSSDTLQRRNDCLMVLHDGNMPWDWNWPNVECLTPASRSERLSVTRQ